MERTPLTRPSRPRFSFLALGPILLASGCGRAEVPVFPVTGKVVVDGQPAAGAEVTFHPRKAPDAKVPLPVAVAEADGTFHPSTRLAHDGAPAGDYDLTVVWRKSTVVQGEEIAGPDLLLGKYADPAASGLKATVGEGPNELPPIILPSPRR